MSDRAVQDALIRALADAPFRASADWRRRELADGERLDRFARFLARHYYYERLVHFFRYSRTLARVTGRAPEAVLGSADFDRLLPTIVLGSRESAVAVAGLAVTYLRAGRLGGIPYHAELLRYEQAMMVVESGARVWRDGVEAASGSREAGLLPIKVEGTMLLDLAYDLPLVLPRLLAEWTDIPLALSLIHI